MAPGRTAGPTALPAAVLTVAALPAGQLRTSVSMGCPFCTVVDRDSRWPLRRVWRDR